MPKLKPSIERFSFAQMTSNNDGKTSGSGTMGVLICTVGSMTFLLGCIDKMFYTHDVDILSQTIVFTSIGAALLGLRKYRATNETASFSVGDENDETNTE